MPGISTVIGLLVTWVPKLLTAGQGILSGGSAVIVAVVTAIPPFVSAMGDFLERVSKSPLLSFLLGAAVCGSIGFGYGLTFDAPLRERARAAAIKAANDRADIAIANIRKQYEARLAAAQKRGRK